MRGLKPEKIRQLVVLSVAGLVGLGCLSVASAGSPKHRNGTHSHKYHGHKHSWHEHHHLKGLRKRLEEIEAAIRALQNGGGGGGGAPDDSRVQALEQEVATLKQQISAIDSGVNALNVDLNTVEAGVAALGSQVNTLQSGVGDLGSSVGTLQSSVSALSGQVSTLQSNVNAMVTDLGELQAINVPADVDVDCAAGDTISAVLATYASGVAPLTIRISGTCNESVTILRSNVTLIAESGATLQVPAGAYGISVDKAARGVSVVGLSILGGKGAALVTRGSQVEFANVTAQGSDYGIVSSDNAVADITSSTLQGNTLYGAYAIRNGVVNISNSVVQGMNSRPTESFGVFAYRGGVVRLSATTVTNNYSGAVARVGGVLEVSSSTITNNEHSGILVYKASSVAFPDDLNNLSGNPIGISCTTDAGYWPEAPSGSPGTGTINRCAK